MKCCGKDLNYSRHGVLREMNLLLQREIALKPQQKGFHALLPLLHFSTLAF